MRVTISHHELTTGFLFRKPLHEVHLTVDFSFEERQIIAQRNLADQVLLDRLPADARPEDDREWYLLKVGHLLERRPDRFRCANPAAAKRYEAELVQALQGLKLWLGENAEPGESLVIEL